MKLDPKFVSYLQNWEIYALARKFKIKTKDLRKVLYENGKPKSRKKAEAILNEYKKTL